MPKMVDLTGQTFGRLKVLSKHPERSKNGSVLWLVKCECGTSEPFLIIGATMKSGNTTSCGCLRREKTAEKFRKHGMHNSPEHRTWVEVHRRCYNENTAQYKDYGGRGIRMSDEWKNSFEAFYRDMGPKPGSAYSIDRIDNNGNYEKGNCRWGTRTTQSNNTSTNVRYDFEGESLTIAELASRFNMPYATMRMRLIYFPIDVAVNKDIRFLKFKFTMNGVTKTMKEWLAKAGITFEEYVSRRELGWSIEDSLSPVKNKVFTVDGVSETLSFWLDLYSISDKQVINKICREVIDGNDLLETIKKLT